LNLIANGVKNKKRNIIKCNPTRWVGWHELSGLLSLLFLLGFFRLSAVGEERSSGFFNKNVEDESEREREDDVSEGVEMNVKGVRNGRVEDGGEGLGHDSRVDKIHEVREARDGLPKPWNFRKQ